MDKLTGPTVGISRSPSLEMANVIVLALRSRGVRAVAVETCSVWESLGSSPHPGAVVIVQQVDAVWAMNVLKQAVTDAKDTDWSQAAIDSLLECCTACGYSLDGLKRPDRCPECGAATGADVDIDDAPTSPSARNRRVRRLFNRSFRIVAALLLATLFATTLIATIVLFA